MTLPNAEEGLSELISLAFATTGTDGSIPGLQNNDQPTIEALLKQRMFDSAGWQGAHLAGFAGLPSGIPLVLGILSKLAEQITGLPVTTWITMWTSNPTVSGLVDIVQDALAKIFTVNVNLQSIWEGLDFNDLDFSPEAAWDIVRLFIPDWLEELIFGGGDSGEEGMFPLEFPFMFGAEPNVVTQFFYWIRKFTGIDDFDDLFSLNLVDLLVNFIETLLKPRELLAWLDGNGILPDFQAPQIVHDVMDAIIKGFAGNPLTAPLVPALQSVWDVISNLLGIGNDAQTTGTDNTAEIAAIKAGLAGAGVGGGVSVSDYFDRPASTSAGADYTQVYSGAGGGTDGTDGTGDGHWFPSGGGIRTVINRHNTALSTNTQYAAMVLADAPTLILVGSYGYRSLAVRCNTAATTCVRLDVIYDSIRLMAVVGGTETLLGQAFGLSLKPGDFWEIFAGTAAEPYRFVVKLNGITRIDVVDSSHVSQIGASYLYPAYGCTAGNYLNIIFLTQYPPMDVAAFSAADRTG